MNRRESLKAAAAMLVVPFVPMPEIKPDIDTQVKQYIASALGMYYGGVTWLDEDFGSATANGITWVDDEDND